MAGIDDLFKGNAVTGIAVGIGVAILAPVIVPVVAAIAKPLAKSAIKAGMVFYEKGRETVAELGEVFEDLVAEAKAEMEAGATAAAAAIPAPPQAETTPEEGVQPQNP